MHCESDVYDYDVIFAVSGADSSSASIEHDKYFRALLNAARSSTGPAQSVRNSSPKSRTSLYPDSGRLSPDKASDLTKTLSRASLYILADKMQVKVSGVKIDGCSSCKSYN